MEAILTSARQSVWEAIDNWPPLAGRFKRTWRFDSPQALTDEPVPSPADLPALAIYPARSPESQWVLNQSHLIPYTLEATLWTRHWSLPLGEELFEEIVRALFRSAPEGEPSYVFQATGRDGADIGPLSVSRQRLGERGPLCTVWRWPIGLRIRWNPALPRDGDP